MRCVNWVFLFLITVAIGAPGWVASTDRALSSLPAIKSEDDDKSDFGESFASRIDRIIKKKTFEIGGNPWTLQGLPLIFPSPTNGFNLGLKVAMQNIRRQDPHELEFDAQILASDKGRYKHFLKIDAPHAFADRARVTLRLAYDRDISLRYFGIGNDTVVDKARLAQDAIDYQNVRAGPSIKLDVLRYVGKKIRLGPVIHLKWTGVIAPPGSLLDAQKPIGIAGGKTHTVGFGIIHDTLDWEPYPSRGGINELYLALASRITGSDYNFFRATWTYRRYKLLHRRLIFAHRTLIESLTGNVPFFELGAVGGSNPSLALGGDRYMRGFEPNRFLDKLRMVVGFELRWDPVFFVISKQDVTLSIVPFIDIGRVWPSVFPLDLGRWHASAGWGTRLVWNSRFIIRGDFAVNSEGTGFSVSLGNAF